MLGPMPARACLCVTLALAGCRGASEPAPADADARPEPSADSETGVTEAIPPAEPGDPFLGIEAMRPRPWAAWPLENVDIAGYDGWHVDFTGAFVLARGLTFNAEANAFVLAIADGLVAEVKRSEDGALELRIDHGEGIETHYAPLSDALVHAGLPIDRGAAIGLASGPTLRLRVTVDGVDIDPLLVLRQPIHRWPALVQAP
jgi:murein DD-endopeptidase MepM/ murein hydrolase activator NlpD